MVSIAQLYKLAKNRFEMIEDMKKNGFDVRYPITLYTAGQSRYSVTADSGNVIGFTLMDGHHRLSAALLLGEKKIWVTTTPLSLRLHEPQAIRSLRPS